jgi:hypothetical protein
MLSFFCDIDLNMISDVIKILNDYPFGFYLLNWMPNL